MTTIDRFYRSNQVGTLHLHYWPAFEVTVHDLPQGKIEELEKLLNAFVSELQHHDKTESQQVRRRTTRSLSCPLSRARTIPSASSKTENIIIQRRTSAAQMHQPFLNNGQPWVMAQSTIPPIHNQKGNCREPPNQGERQGTLQDMQINPYGAPTHFFISRN